jgi:hypothetical protein
VCRELLLQCVLEMHKVVFKCFYRGLQKERLVGTVKDAAFQLIPERIPAQVLLQKDGQHHNREKTEELQCTVWDVTQKN